MTAPLQKIRMELAVAVALALVQVLVLVLVQEREKTKYPSALKVCNVILQRNEHEQRV